MLNLDNYFASVIGKNINVNGDQCVGFFNDYNKKLGNPATKCSWASDLFTDRKRNGMSDWYYEVPTKEAKKGDVCIWKWDRVVNNPEFHNHVSIFDSWTESSKTHAFFFEQNFPNDGKHRYVTRNAHTLRTLIGVMRPKVFIPIGSEIVYNKAYDRPFTTAKTEARTLGSGVVIAKTEFADFGEYQCNNFIVNNGKTVIFVNAKDITSVKEAK